MTTEELSRVQLGDYTILRKLGEGMMGAVFLAQHRFLKKPYVLKVFPEELSQNQPFIQRFEKEVALLASLDHPHIAKVENVSSFEGQYFLVSECLTDANGVPRTLATHIKERGRLPEEEILLIAKQLASALDYAHQKSISDEPIAHRGLKLNNIILTPGSDEIEVKITDFGLSRIVGLGSLLSKTYQTVWDIMADQAQKEGGEQALRESFYQHFVFLAPEQRGGGEDSRDADVKADVYAFGVLIYFLLAGYFPEGFFPMPSQVNAALKKNWDPLVRACLSLDPEDRPLLLSEMVHQLCEREASEPKPLLRPQEIKRPEYEEDPAAVFQTDKTVARYVPKEAEIKEMEPIYTKMEVISGGTYLRGSNHGARDEMPRHAVNLPSFAIDVHPVTNEQFVRFLSVMGGEKDGNNNDMIRLRDSRIRRNGGKLTIESGYAKHPVVGVTWYGAFAYAKWIGKRLPTEAEWEVAASSGNDGAQYPTGDDLERSQANFFNSDTTAVMSYPANESGLFDMAGNVYEWCGDWYGYHYYETSMQEPDSPQGPPQGVYRVLRGGCWKSLKEDMRCSHRHRNNPGSMNGTYGFRCAADVANS